MFHALILRLRPASRKAACGALLAALAAAVFAGPSHAEAPRVLPEGQLPADQRLGPLKDLDGYFPFHPPATRQAWEQRAERVRRQLLVALGLWPLPTAVPANPVIHGLIDQGDYTIEKVYFESMPGFYVTGNLYRPKLDRPGKRPGVLCPHGHWSEGRFYDAGQLSVRKQIIRGGERFEDGGRSPLQSRCVQLARMGCVVFHYDMIGYADSGQISFELAHRFARQRAAMNSAEGWGLYSPQAESNLQSVMGLQTLNSIRALDFLVSLPDVDSQRLAVTGASGGGTQTMILAAIDPRVTVSVPAVMVSTAMQGGCTCENACLLRVGTGNVEFAALFAPQPLCLISANDWTKEMSTKGFPELEELFKLLGAISHVEHHPFTWFDHNYNYVSRSAMYQFVNKHLRLELDQLVVEEAYPRLTSKELSVWDDQHPRPAGGEDFERSLLRWWHNDVQQKLRERIPQDAAALGEFRRVVGGAIEVLVGADPPASSEVAFQSLGQVDAAPLRIERGLLKTSTNGSELPCVILEPAGELAGVAVWLHRDGKGGLFGNDQVRPPVLRLLDRGIAVIGVDLLYQGEFLAPGKPLEKTPRVDNPRESAAYTFGYNDTVFAQRVQDVLSCLTLARQRAGRERPVFLVGLDGAGAWAAAALALGDDVVSRAAIDTAGFRFAAVTDLQSPDFLPGGAKYLDLPGMLAAAAPKPLWLAGEQACPEVVTAAYKAAGHAELAVDGGETGGDKTDRAIEWLLR